MKTKTIRKSKYTNGGMKFYKSGGMHYMNGGLPGYGQKRKFEAGGSVYDDNTVQAAGQGNVQSTANTVFQESNPALQEQRLKSLEATRLQSIKDAQNTTEKVEQIGDQGDLQAQHDAEMAKVNYLAKEESIANTAKMGYDIANQAGVFDGIKATRAANLALTTAGGTAASTSVGALNAGSQAIDKGMFLKKSGQVVAKDVGTELVRNKVVGEGATTLGGGVAKGTFANASLLGTGAKTAGKMSGFGGAGLTGVGTIGKFATSGAGLGIAANLVGSGISRWSDDGDPTKSNFGEYSGAVLSGAGTGASYGSFLGPAGTLIGGIAGGIYGGVKQFFGTNKAKRAKEDAIKKFKAKQTKAIKKGNKDLMANYGSQMSQANAGRIANKTYSGYDLGQNVVAQRGGYRNMPQYI
tara:strand:+ start:5778 stop:7004 length:1227 start_codon:yes stop_codon:yes gene_type:complete